MSEQHCPSCGSCGFPMLNPSDFAGGNPTSAYCSSCGDDAGNRKPFSEVLQVNADYLVREQALDPGAAREMARALLIGMPAWKDQA